MIKEWLERFASYQVSKALPKLVKGAVAGSMGVVGGLLLNAKVVAAQTLLRKYGIDLQLDPNTIQASLTIAFTGVGNALLNFLLHKGADSKQPAVTP